MSETPCDEFRLIVAGGRDFSDYSLLSNTLFDLSESSQFKDRGISLVSGMARGADSLAVQFAREHNVKLYEFPADWNTHGKRAGYLRNQQMAEHSQGLLAFWDGQSRGTKHMIDIAHQSGLFVHVVNYISQ